MMFNIINVVVATMMMLAAFASVNKVVVAEATVSRRVKTGKKNGNGPAANLPPPTDAPTRRRVKTGKKNGPAVPPTEAPAPTEAPTTDAPTTTWVPSSTFAPSETFAPSATKTPTGYYYYY